MLRIHSLHVNRAVALRIVPDGQLWRIEWPDIGLSDRANLTRCKAAAIEWVEHKAATEDRKKNAARRLKSLSFFWTSSFQIAPIIRAAA
jgi:hypothetical protein